MALTVVASPDWPAPRPVAYAQEVSVRASRVADAPSIAEAHIRSWQAAYRGLLPDEMLDGLDAHLPERARRWGAVIAYHRDDVLVAEVDGEVVGFARISRCRDTDHGLLHSVGEVQAIYLKPEAWGLGLGRILMARSEANMVGRGFTNACLWVLESNLRARRFYEAAGWLPDGSEKAETQPGASLHEVRYVKGL